MKSKIPTSTIGHNYIWKDEIDSTNEEVKRQIHQNAPHGTVVAAGSQTNGKGRRGRVWESPKGDNIYLSILLRPKMEPKFASMVTLVAALAVAKTAETVAGVSCQIKWPNDLVLNRKKICGILTEMVMGKDGSYALVVGIGINVNRKDFSKEIQDMATSFEKETGKRIDENVFIHTLLEEFERYYELFIQHLSLAPMLKEYNERLINVGEHVQILSGQERLIRRAHGIDETGTLLVSNEMGQIEKIISGEVSVRGLYGYV